MKPTRNEGGFWFALVCGEWQPVKVYQGGDVETIGSDQALDIDDEVIWAWASREYMVYGGRDLTILQDKRLKCPNCNPPKGWCEEHRIESIDGPAKT